MSVIRVALSIASIAVVIKGPNCFPHLACATTVRTRGDEATTGARQWRRCNAGITGCDVVVGTVVDVGVSDCGKMLRWMPLPLLFFDEVAIAAKLTQDVLKLIFIIRQAAVERSKAIPNLPLGQPHAIHQSEASLAG